MEGSALRGRALMLGPKEVGSREMGLRRGCVPEGGGENRLWGTQGWALSGGPPPMGGGRGVGPRLVDPSLLAGTRGLVRGG